MLKTALSALVVLGWPAWAAATPQFAREYRVDCSRCHVAPPMLNREGEDFLARGYRFDGDNPPRPTPPLAVWNTIDLEHRASADLTKGFPSRVELIASGSIRRRAFYFVELRALSQQIGSGGRLLNRSGRFEDLFIGAAVDGAGALTVTAGQFRALSQVDVSRRLGVSEPLAFSASVPGPPALAGSRLTSLRAFSPAGRQPAVRLSYAAGGPRRRPADGWQSAITLPLTGELTLPFTEAASFEIEGRPKGVFLESFHRAGLNSVGGHVFVGGDRSLGHLVVTRALAGRVFLTGAAGYQRVTGASRGRFSAGGDIVITRRVIAGGRVDHLTSGPRDPALVVYLNTHLPFGPPWFRQALRLQVEQRIQPDDHRTLAGVSHVF